ADTWIGLNDVDSENTWVWASGQPVTYTYWVGSHPHADNRSYNYAYIHYGNALWYNAYNEYRYRGLIEIEGVAGNDVGPGPFAQYVLDVDMSDPIPPRVTAVNLPAEGSTSGNVVRSISVTVSEDLDPATVNKSNPFVVKFSGHFYTLTPSTMTWDNAEAWAFEKGGHLVTVDDEAEQLFLQRWFAQWGTVWIGLTDKDTEGSWAWISGEPVTYTKWAASRPRTSSASSYDYAAITAYGYWDDYTSSSTAYGLVELPSATDSDADGVPDVLDVYPNDARNAYDLREAGADGIFDTEDDVIYNVYVYSTYSTGTSISLMTLDGPLASGTYRFTVNANLTDNVGNQLDGDGDGTGGDAFTRTFTVALPAGYVFEGRNNGHYAWCPEFTFTESPAGSGYYISTVGYGSIDPNDGSTWGENDIWEFQALAGDKIAAWMDTPDSSLDARLYLYSANLAGLSDQQHYDDYWRGPEDDAYISGYTIPADGTYYLWITHQGTATGTYIVHVDLVRNGTQIETDGEYSNNSIGNANALTLASDGNHRLAAVAGTIMGNQNTTADYDYFRIGVANVGNIIELGTRLPAGSTLVPKVVILDAAGTAMTDEDGNPNDGHALLTVAANDTYYARIENATWRRDGSLYMFTTGGSITWADAEAQAVAAGGHLVTINNQAEYDYVWDNFSCTGVHWIGLTDQAVENTWVWASGQPVTFTKWVSGRPYADNTSYNWAYMHENGWWYDAYLSWTYRGLIEIEGVAGPDVGPGPFAQYVLDVDMSDSIPPRVTAVNLPAEGATTSSVIRSISVTASEDLDPATVNKSNPFVVKFGGHYYTLTPTSMTWANAEAWAVEKGGHLATINDAAEQQFLEKWFCYYGPWIGITDKDVEGTWTWVSGEPVGYSKWATSRPRTSNAGNYDYARITAYGYWDDVYYSDSNRGLVELAGVADGDSDGVPDVLDVQPTEALNTYDLREAGTDGIFDTEDDVIYNVYVYSTYTAGTTISLMAQDGPLGNGLYRLMVSSTVADKVGNQLDGNGDGTGGDAFQRIFSVALPAGVAFEGRANDHYAAATPLPLAEDPAGSGHYLAHGIGSIDPNDGSTWWERDIWSFNALAGDQVSIYMDTPGSPLDARMYLYMMNPSALTETYITEDYWRGPDDDAFISCWTVPSDGTYYVYAVHQGSAVGSYYVHVELTRGGTQIESDAEYSNDSIASSNTVTLQTVETHRIGRIAGTVMAPQSGNVDEDFFNLGTIEAGKTVFLSVRLPQNSVLRPAVEIRNAQNGIVFIDPNPSEGVARADITTTGTYYAVLVAMSGEGSFGQYVMDVAIWPTGELTFADLVASDVTVDPAAASSGDQVTISWTVGNYGTGNTDATDWSDRIVLSPNDRYGDSDDVYLASVPHTGALNTTDNTSYAASATISLPLGLNGTYWVFASTDEDNAVFEYIFENNNAGQSGQQLSVTLTPYADLEASSASMTPTVAVAGQSAQVSWTVTNLGPGTTGTGIAGGEVSSWIDRIICSRNSIYGDGDDVLVANVQHEGALAASASYAGSWTGSLPAGLNGAYHLFVFTDAGNAVYEYTDTHANLTDAGIVNVAPGPFADLQVTAAAGPESIRTGGQISVSWTVENSVNAWVATPQTAWYDAIVLSTDAIQGNGDDRSITSFHHSGALGIGASYDRTETVTIPSNISGRFYLFVVTDLYNHVAEFIYENNNARDAGFIHVGDWFVSASAADPQYGTADHPFATIQQAVDAALTGDVINVAPGTYAENVSIADKALTIDGGWNAGFVSRRSSPGATFVSGTSPAFTYSNSSAGKLIYLVITGGSGTDGGAIAMTNSSPAIENCIITGNSATAAGGAIACDASAPSITNSTITGNSATAAGGAIAANNGSAVTIKNCIILGNTAPAGAQIALGSGSPTVSVTYSDVAGGQAGVAVASGTLNWGTGNIDADPIFASSGDYHLQSREGRWNPSTSSWVVDAAYSPCIDKGDPASAFANEPMPNKGRINMGAYGNTPEASKSFVFVLTVQSSPAGVAITGDKPGTTNYSVPCDVGEIISLSAPAQPAVNGVQCTFVRWKLDGADQADGVTSLQVTIDAPHTALAVYTVPLPVTTLTTSPAQPNGLDGWFVSRPWISLGTTGVAVKQIHYWWNSDPETVVNGTSAGFYAIGGDNILHYYAIDGLDQQEAEQQTQIKWDDTTPTVSIQLAGTDAGGWFTSAVTATVVGDGAGRTITSTEIKVDNLAWAAYTGPATISSDGWHYVYARITTVTGKTVQTNVGFQIDALPPVTTLTTTPSQPNGVDDWFMWIAPQIRLAAADIGGSVKEIRYWWNGDAPTVVSAAQTTFTAPVGDNLLHYYAVDTHNNAETEQQRQIKFDDSAPDLRVLSITRPAQQWSGHTFDVSWTVMNEGAWQAPGPWVDRVYLSADDQFGSDVVLGSAQYNGTLGIGSPYTRTISVTLPHGISGQYWLIVRADINNALLESNEDNNVKVSDPMQIEMSPYPELSVVSITAPATANPGDQVSIQWKIRNSGNGDAVGSWTDRIYLSSDQTIGDDQEIGTFTYSAAIAAGTDYIRTGSVTIPNVNASGNLWVVVKIDTADTIFEFNEDNNAGIDDQSINIPAGLTLTFASTSIPENAPVPYVVGTIKRNTGTAGSLVVSLANTLPARITVPATVTIPAGQISTTFNATVVNDLLINGTQDAIITASAAGFLSSAGTISVQDDEFAALTLVIDGDQIDEGGVNSSTTATLTRNTGTAGDLLVFLATIPPQQASVPQNVTIPDGLASTTFTVAAVDDQFIDGTVKVTVSASGSNFRSGSDTLLVNDNDIPNLAVMFDSPAIVESAHSPAAIGTVYREPAGPFDLLVRLSSGDKTEATVTYETVIPANEASANFIVNAVDDSMVDGTQTVTITAFVTINGTTISQGSGQATIDVTDDDGPTLTLTIADDVIGEGTVNPATTGVVARNTSTAEQLVVSLASSDTTEATVAPTVTIPAGAASIPLDINVVDDGVQDGVQRVTITASAAGFDNGFDYVDVSDLQVPDLRVTNVAFPPDAMSNQPVLVTWTVLNGGLGIAEGTWSDIVSISTDNQIGNDTSLTGMVVTESITIGQTYERTLEVTLPNVVGDFYLLVTTDATNLVVESPGTGERNNTRIAVTPIHIAPSYHATVQTDVEVAVAGTPVPMYGSAFNAVTAAPEPFKDVTVRVRSLGFRRVINVTTDANGDFETTFQPLPTEGGQYVIGADHPSVGADPTQDQFILLGMRISPTTVSERIIPTYELTKEVDLRNLADVELTGLQAVAIGAPPNITVGLTLPDTLPASGTVKLGYTLLAADASITWAKFGVQATSAEGASALLEINVVVEPRVPRLLANPGYLQSGMVRGVRKVIGFEVSNVGGAATGEVSVLLPDVPWMSLLTPPVITSMEPGDTRLVNLALDPPANLALTYYDGALALTSEHANLNVSFRFRAISEAVGDLRVTVTDEYTFFVDGAPKVAGATAKLIDPLDGSTVAETTSGADGVALLSNVKEGQYILEVRAERHGTYRAGVTIVPGQTAEMEVFIERQVVTYNWTVVPTEIEDHYRITLEAVFETNVPIPVVTVDPAFIVPIVIEGETTQMEFTMTNHGLIAVKGLTFNAPVSDSYNVVPLITEIDEL
ncbi:MAG TPA: CARDB domain-containing protein, partial [Planctomycetota bacterium]|nr:CARDB domain-containing protein [Planctomycetota bacterium]